MNLSNLKWIIGASVLLLATGCGSSRDVEVSGNVGAAADVPSGEPVRLEFYERLQPEAEGEEGKVELVYSSVLEEAGEFAETIPLAGDDLFVVAIVDTNGDGACTDGEAWASVETTVDETDSVTLNLSIEPRTACPAVEIAE